MLQTPSINRSLRGNHVAATPTRPSHTHRPSPVLLDSPPKYSLFTTPHLSRNYAASKIDERATFSSDPNTSDAEDQYEEEDAFFDDDVEAVLDGSPTTPAPRKLKSCLSLAELSVTRRHKPSSAKLPTPGDRIAPPQFGTTPRILPQTPRNADDEWRNHAGAESMTRLSIDDSWSSNTGPNSSLKAWSGKSISAKDRKRPLSTGSYKLARYNKAGSPQRLIERSDSPTSREAEALFQSGNLFGGRTISKSPEGANSFSPFSSSARFPPLQFSMGVLSQETVANPEPSSPEPFPPLPNLAGSSPFAPLPALGSFKRAPSPSRSNMSLSTSASTASNTSYSSPSVERLHALSDLSNAPRIARKFKPKPRTSSAAGTDDSDGGAGDVSFGSTSSLFKSNNNQPFVVDLADDAGFNLVTPSFEPSPASKWPAPAAPRRSGLTRSESIDPDEMLFHLARSAQEVEAANAKPVMPDTPIKRHPAKPRTWASTGKNWGLSAGKEVAFKGAPRKSLPLQLFGAIPDSPDSADSDPSPSKVGKRVLSRSSMPARRKSAGALRGSLSSEPGSPIAALPLQGPTSSPDNPLENQLPRSLRRTDLLTAGRTGSSHSINSDISTDDSHTPTKRGVLPPVWKAPALAVHDSDSQDPLDAGLSGPSKGAFGIPPSSPGQRVMPPPPTPISKRPSLTTIDGSPSESSSLQAWSSRIHSTVGRRAKPDDDAGELVVPHRLHGHHGPVKSFLKARPSLQTSTTPLRSSLRRESHPAKPVAAIGWGTPIASSSSVGSRGSLPLFTGSQDGGRLRHGPHKENPLFLSVAASPPALRRPRSSSRVPLLRDHRSPDSNDHLVQERPGHFERDFEKDGAGILGKGTFGQVFRVKKRGSGAIFAVKRSKPYEGARHRARLLEEVDVLRHLTLANGSTQSTPSTHRTTQGHDNVLHFIDAWEQDCTLYIQTELCELGSLETYLAGYGKIHDRLDEGRLWKILSEVANGLLHIHRCGVLHLDLKPANIFVTDEGRLRIGDFGMATRWPRLEAQSNEGGGFEREGDREYLAAEILVGVYGPAADIFSFGMIMLEAAGNIVVPSYGEMWHALRNDDFSAVCLDGYSFVLVNTIRSMMAADYTTRPSIEALSTMDPVLRARAAMKRTRLDRLGTGKMFKASAFAAEGPGFLTEILGAEVVATIQPAPAGCVPSDADMDLGE